MASTVLVSGAEVTMIHGLKLTLSGEELRMRLEQGVQRHEREASRWTRETLRGEEDATEDAPLLPEEMCEHEAERHTWRAAVLGFIRDHIDAGETYRLGAADLEYAELLPEKPGRWNRMNTRSEPGLASISSAS
jgi:hypothetical protein